MIDLYNLRPFILNSIKEVWETKTLDEECEFYSWQNNTNRLELSSLLPHLPGHQKFYFRNRDKSKSFLGIEVLESYRGGHLMEKVQKLTDLHPELTLMGMLSFNQKEAVSEEWKSFGKGHFFLPLILLSNSGSDTKVQINLPKNSFADKIVQMQILLRIEKALSFIFKEERLPEVASIEELPSKEGWNTTMASALNQLKSDRLQKVVLARKELIKFKSNVNAATIFNNLKDKNSNSYTLFYQIRPHAAFISFSPEKLFSVQNNHLEVDSIAGTTSRGLNEEDDSELANQLLRSQKDRGEQKQVTDEVVAYLEKIGLTPLYKKEPKIIKLKYIQHLHTPISAKFVTNTNLDTLLHGLHPTPAVGGRPKRLANEFIRKHEDLNRGSYAAPIGIISKDQCEMAVGIRSALVYKDQLHVYAGAGIVNGSDTEAEWIETKNKMKNFKYDELSKNRKPQSSMVLPNYR